MFVSSKIITISTRYIIWLGFATLFFIQMGAIVVRGQSVDMGAPTDRDPGNGRSPALSQGLGGPVEEVEGLRSSIDDRELSLRQSTLVGDDERAERYQDYDGDDYINREADAVRHPRDRGFRGESEGTEERENLDGSLGAQYEAAQRRPEPPRDGDFGAVIGDGDEQGAASGFYRERGGFRQTNGGFVPQQGRPTYPNDVAPSFPVAADTARHLAASTYQALGVRVGSFRVFPEVTLSGLGMDNVRETSGPRDSDVAIEMHPYLRVLSDWRRHALEVNLDARGSFHRDFSSEDDREFLSDLRGRLDITRRSNIEGEAGYSLRQQSRGTADAPGNAIENPDVHSMRAALALNHRFNRLSIRLRGESVQEKYDDARLVGGGVSDESDQDNRDDRLSLRGRYEFNPGLSLFAEGLVETLDFRRVSNSDGILRDASGFGLRAGIGFDNGSKLYGEASLGFINLDPDDQRLSDVEGVTFDANVTWHASALTTFSFDASTDINATTVAGSAAALSHAANLRVQHELLRHFILSAELGLNHVDYKGSNLVERTYSAGLEAAYLFSREVALIGSYEFEAFRSNAQNSDYDSNQLRLGMRLRR